ncbi:MAG: long-chain fatty acid transporter [Sideroxydans sp.]|nr:long-chain fatty acid transporter [Sideroxydans sp.]
MIKQKVLVSVLIAGGLISPLAHATDGYFSHGYGMKAKGMGGAGIALPQDALAAATNPAGMVMVGDRIDFGIDYFKPTRSAQTVGTAGGTGALDQSLNGNGTSSFLIPEFGYNKMISSDTSLGIAVYGNGGMNTTYTSNVKLFGTTNAGIDMSQLFIAPTWAMKLNPTNAVGVSLNLAYQIFAASGAQNFAATPPSSAPANVTDLGHDHSTGWGLRFGWTGEVTPTVTVGATYQTKTKMSKFSKYQGFFAEQGGFDIPANFGFGVAVKATPDVTVAADLERIQYSGVASVGNPLLPNLTTSLLGTAGGAGFGWKDQTILKLGVSYKYQPDLVLRAGYNHGTAVIPSSETFFNIFAPATVQDHLTLGATYTLANKAELTVAYMHAFKKTINGTNSIPVAYGGGEANLSMYQDSIGIAYGW